MLPLLFRLRELLRELPHHLLHELPHYLLRLRHLLLLVHYAAARAPARAADTATGRILPAAPAGTRRAAALAVQRGGSSEKKEPHALHTLPPRLRA
jgi:hypothetical protein